MRINKITLTIVVTIGLGFLFGGYFYNKWYHKNIKSYPQMYAYQTFWGPVNPVMIVEDGKHKNALIKYYEQVENGKNPIFNFPLRTLPQYDPVYVVGYTKDSLLAEVVSYYDYGARMGGSFTKGWVYAKCLHKEPPQKEEIKE